MIPYDSSNVFAKILRGEITCKKIKETKMTLSFHDAFPKALLHALVIPKNEYINLEDFIKKASKDEVIDFWETVTDVVDILKLNKYGFRMITNTGIYAGQEVPHFHVHLCGGNDLGPMLMVK